MQHIVGQCDITFFAGLVFSDEHYALIEINVCALYFAPFVWAQTAEKDKPQQYGEDQVPVRGIRSWCEAVALTENAQQFFVCENVWGSHFLPREKA